MLPHNELFQRVAMIVVTVSLAACGGGPINYVPCLEFIACYEGTGGTKGEFDSRYGRMGTCWTGTRAAADACTAECTAKLSALEMTFPDAGCGP